MNRRHSSWLLGCFGCYFFKRCRCWTWRWSYFLFWPASVSTNELTSWIGCVRWGRQCWAAPGQFWEPFQRHALNVTHICMHTSIAVLVTSCLNWPRHCMHVVYFALWYEWIQATARMSVSALVWLSHLPLKWSGSARLKHLRIDVSLKTFCDWINAQEKTDRNSSYELISIHSFIYVTTCLHT